MGRVARRGRRSVEGIGPRSCGGGLGCRSRGSRPRPRARTCWKVRVGTGGGARASRVGTG
eukprot:6209559-Pleurochrysis_carterae.AAC.1